MFNGDCAAAIKFYEETLGAKVEFKMTYGESPEAPQCSPESLDKIMHARFSVAGNVLMVSDAPADRYHPPQGFFVSLGIASPTEAERIFAALSEGGMVYMPIQETFWAIRFGMFADRFGIPWMINCEKPA
jgi:PhnB protein